ncbi:MAG: SAM-dependent methyltransferase [Treponema sp.]|nr:SAM-dependent methyltransferase [Treponema sp.]MEE3434903.1 SAM-dependent methyltransferase [Treponema sp.]
MILSATLSKPTSQVEAILGKKYERVKIRFKGGTESPYFAEFFTQTQSFHKNFSQTELDEFLQKNIGRSFKNCVERTEEKEITFLANKRGEVKRLEKALAKTGGKPKNAASQTDFKPKNGAAFGEKTALFGAAASAFNAHKGALNRSKNYIIQEGTQVPFLQALGVMTDAGKVVAAKYDKFRQVNRFLELLDDVLPSSSSEPLQILDFGSGKSYLTFAVQYFLESVKKIPCQITGVDLKEDVIKSCSDLAARLGVKNMNFVCGDIAKYSGKNPDIVITLHACDVATDYALAFAVERGAKAILSVPCCQKEVNAQLGKSSNALFAPLLRHGIFRERFSALMTDAVRAQLLEARGYKVQVLEFIDMEGTPKNLMIRALLKGGARLGQEAISGAAPSGKEPALGGAAAAQSLAFEQSARDLLKAFGARQKLADLLGGGL